MTKANAIAAMTAKLFLTAALAIGAANIVLADDDGHGGEKTRFCTSGRRTRLTLRRISWR